MGCLRTPKERPPEEVSVQGCVRRCVRINVSSGCLSSMGNVLLTNTIIRRFNMTNTILIITGIVAAIAQVVSVVIQVIDFVGERRRQKRG